MELQKLNGAVKKIDEGAGQRGVQAFYDMIGRKCCGKQLPEADNPLIKGGKPNLLWIIGQIRLRRVDNSQIALRQLFRHGIHGHGVGRRHRPAKNRQQQAQKPAPAQNCRKKKFFRLR